MCGIGLQYINNDQYEDKSDQLLKLLKHRGPDDSSKKYIRTSKCRKLVLVHTRLSILDLSTNGRQPMEDNYGNIIIFNGEIYNFKELKRNLEKKGIIFKTNTDTEVLLNLLNFYDLKYALNLLRGMFAFAYWRKKNDTLIIARDPLGIKQIYYKNNGEFSAASETKVLIKSGLANKELCKKGLDTYLSYGSVIEPRTIWKDISSVLPGHYLIVNGDGKILNNENYWNIKNNNINIKESLIASAKRHLISDVPISLFLSGGYDSTAIATLSRNCSNIPIECFTLDFPEEKVDSEGVLAKQIAHKLGYNHNKINITKKDIRKKIKKFFDAMDQPSDDGLNVNLISSYVSDQNYKVALHGVGGDELFGGYPSFRDLPLFEYFKFIPKKLRKVISSILKLKNNIASIKLQEILNSDCEFLNNFLIRRRLLSYIQRRNLYDMDPPYDYNNAPDEWIKFINGRISGIESNYSKTSILELSLYASNKLLRDGDVMSMANGLEVRFPLLDVQLVNSVISETGNNIKYKNESLKPTLTNNIENFPLDLISKSKRGFTIPLNKWIKEEFNEEISDSINSLASTFNFSKVGVNNIYKSYYNSNNGQEWIRVWQLYVLNSWYKNI